MKNLKLSAALIFASMMSGCVTFPTPESEKVNVIWDDVTKIQDCQLIKPVYGSEGSFYDYWLHADKNMLWSALNQMRIQTAKSGGDVLYLYRPLSFTSSVTLLGNAYACSEAARIELDAIKRAKEEAKMKKVRVEMETSKKA